MTRRNGWAAALVVGAAALLAGCTNARVGVGLPMAVIYKNTTAPLTADIDRRTGAPMVIPKEVRVGRASAYGLDFSIPGLEFTRPFSVGWGKMDLQKAMENGGLGKVSYGDGQEIQILKVFTKATIIVYGPPVGAVEEAPTGPPAEGGPPR